jgi:hypothetical protein
MRLAVQAARLAALLGLLAIAGAGPVHAQDNGALERRVKAAFLYKFTGYVDWADNAFASPTAPLVIGVMGDEALAAETVQIVAGRSIDGRPLAVRRVTLADLAAGVHMLFVARSETGRLAQILKALPPGPVLVVTESEETFPQGSAINFVLVDGRVRFDVAMDAAERRGARLSSRLLGVARSVKRGP